MLTIVLIFPVRIPAFIYLGLWFLYQLVAADYDLFSASANGAGTAFFSHIGGFLFGILVAWVYVRRTADERSRSARHILA